MNECTSSDDTIRQYILTDPRYPFEAYIFMLNGFKEISSIILSKNKKIRHVTGQEASYYLADYAKKLYGPMAEFTLSQWFINRTEDFGELVYNLITMELFSKTEKDKKEDFQNVFNLKSYLRDSFN